MGSPLPPVAARTNLAVRVVSFTGALILPVAGYFNSYPEWHNDAVQAWVTLTAGLQGIDTGQTVMEMARQVGVADWWMYPDLGTTRPPGFYPLHIWAVTPMVMMVGTGLVNAFSFTYLTRGSVWIAGALFLLLAQSLSWLNPAVTWGALIAVTWNHLDDDWKWGIPLGVAAANRLWPLLIVVFLLRRKTGLGAAGTFTVFTVAGLLVVPLEADLSGLDWMRVHTNLSVSAVLYEWGVPILVTVGIGSLVVLLVAWKLHPHFGYGVATLGAILLSPLAWPAYLSALTPLTRPVFISGDTFQKPLHLHRRSHPLRLRPDFQNDRPDV